jgi:hypothetical protein
MEGTVLHFGRGDGIADPFSVHKLRHRPLRSSLSRSQMNESLPVFNPSRT